MHRCTCFCQHTVKNGRILIYAGFWSNLLEGSELSARYALDHAFPCCVLELRSTCWQLPRPARWLGAPLGATAGRQQAFRVCLGLFFFPRFQPAAGLMERIQAIAQNVSDIAIKVDQILRNSLLNGKGECPRGSPRSRPPPCYAIAVGRSSQAYHEKFGTNAEERLLICGYPADSGLQG